MISLDQCKTKWLALTGMQRGRDNALVTVSSGELFREYNVALHEVQKESRRLDPDTTHKLAL